MTNREFLALFDEELYISELQAGNKEELLREFVDLLYHTGKISDRDIVLEMLSRRESLGSTAIGKGVAIPHGRTLTARQLIVAFGRCQQGLDYDSPDGDPVHLFFLVVAPYRERQNQYLPALGKVAEFFRKKTLREKILKACNFEEFKNVLTSEAGSE